MGYQLKYLNNDNIPTENRGSYHEGEIFFVNDILDEDDNDYLLTIFHSDFSSIAKKYLDYHLGHDNDDGMGLAKCEIFLDNILKIIIYNPNDHNIEAYYTAITNYMNIMHECMYYFDCIDFFDFTITLITDSMASSFEIYDWVNEGDEHYSSYCNASDHNFAEAFTIIHDGLNKLCPITKKSSEDLKSIYKQVTVPNFSIIKNIRINNHDFKHLVQAQDYANQLVLDNPVGFFLTSFSDYPHKWKNDSIFIDTYKSYDPMSLIEFTVMDDVEIFELTLITDVHNIAKNSLYEILVYDILDDFNGCYQQYLNNESLDSYVDGSSFSFSQYHEEDSVYREEFYFDAFFDLTKKLQFSNNAIEHTTNVYKATEILIEEYAKEIIHIYAVQKKISLSQDIRKTLDKSSLNYDSNEMMQDLHGISYQLDELNSNYLKQYLNISKFEGNDAEYMNYVAAKGLVLLKQKDDKIIEVLKRFEHRLT